MYIAQHIHHKYILLVLLLFLDIYLDLPVLFHPFSVHCTINSVNAREWESKDIDVRSMDIFETITERDLNKILMMKI